MTQAEMKAELERLKAENERLKTAAAKQSTLSFKVSDKAGVSVYGLQRMPVTLYKSQWDRLFAAIPALQAFIALHNGELSQGKAIGVAETVNPREGLTDDQSVEYNAAHPQA